ncbi:MAG: hypothetical protein ABEN55_18980 [Bradymonadaceae bacterium]
MEDTSVLPDGGTTGDTVEPDDRQVPGPLPDCTSTSFCERGICEFDISPPEPIRQTLRVRARGTPPPDATGTAEIQAPVDDATGNAPVYWHRSVAFHERDDNTELDGAAATVAAFPGTYQILWEGWPDSTGPFTRGRLLRDSVGIPTEDDLELMPDDPPAVRLSGSITFNGEKLDERWPKSDRFEPWRTWTLEVSPADSSGTLFYQDGSFQEPSYAFDVPPGTYDVDFQLSRDDAHYPPYQTVLEGAVKGEVQVADDVEVRRDRTLAFDPGTVRLHGSVSVDGEPIAPSNDTGRWALVFERDTRGATKVSDQYHQAVDGGRSYEAWIYPGTYDVYPFPNPVDFTPISGEHPYQVADSLEIREETRLDIDIDRVSTRLKVTWNGEPVGQRIADGEKWRLLLEGTGGNWNDHLFEVGPGESLVEAQMYPGDYEVWIDLPIDADGSVRLAESVSINGGGRHTYDVRTVSADLGAEVVTASGRGIAPNSPHLQFEPSGGPSSEPYDLGGDPITVDVDENGSAAYTLYEGTYEVGIAFEMDSQPKWADPIRIPLERGWRAEDGAELRRTIELPALEGRAEWRGGPMPTRPEDHGWSLVLRERDGDRKVELREPGGSRTYRTPVPPGVWDVYVGFPSYASDSSFERVPGDAQVRVGECVAVPADVDRH